MPRRPTRVSVRHSQVLNEATRFMALASPMIRLPAAAYVRAVRSALRMTQLDLAARAGVLQAYVNRIEKGKDVRLDVLRRLFDAMFCDIVVLPLPRKRLSDAVAERRVETGRPSWKSAWAERPWPPRPGRPKTTKYKRRRMSDPDFW